MTATTHDPAMLTAKLDPLLDAFVGPAAWAATWHALGVEQPDFEIYAQLLRRYSEPHRAYHNVQHLAECLEVRNRLGQCTDGAPEVDLALWFHDAIYDPAARDNEARSARWLDDVAHAAGVDAAIRTRLHALVMATCHQASPASPAEATLVDADLAILGAAPERFDEYCRQIRVEYAHVPSLVYDFKRRQVLNAFSSRPRLYTTEPFYLQLEAQARQNLRRALST